MMSFLRTLMVGITLAGVLTSPSVKADSWRFPATIKSEVENHGDIAVRRIIDARKNQRFPDYTIEVSRGNELMARFPGTYFEQLFAAPDGSFFVGLSNNGLPGTAVIVFDRLGRLRIEVKHDLAEFDYCEHSVTLRRVWFDAENPNVTFTKDASLDAYKVSLRTCKGCQVNLMSAVRDAYNKSFLRATSDIR